jgi:DNA polymerase-3 subunit alpha
MLILWDIIDYCLTNNILVGVGRGSSGGSLIAYLLNITNIDPIKYGLLFERFLNENRVKKSLPDIDSDFEGLRRDDVKAYMENRFGKDHVCSVGTYGNLKLKMIFTDLSRQKNIPIQDVKVMTSILSEGEKDGTDWNEIFYLASKSSKLKSFVNNNLDIINDARLCLMQPRSSSIHACATIITPDDKDIFRWFPVKKEKNRNEEDVLVSEWEGIQLDNAGFLKEDILGISQLDKISNMIRLIKENQGVDIDFRNISLDDKKTYKYFCNGWNEDTFQFGTKGLKQYTKQLKPDNINELSATNALYRPGAMKSNAHNDFVNIKFGRKDVEYDYMLESVTKDTYGLYLYQEQTMLAAQKLGDMTLVEADMMRKVMLGRGKKQQADQFYIYHDKFIKGAINNGCDINEAEQIWLKLEAFAGYGFNKSHAVAYAITGYISQWFKANYPIEFWTTAFKFAKEDKIPDFISEINLTGDIRIMPADINKSRDDVRTDFKSKTIFWSLVSVKQCGDKAASQIIEIRDQSGDYFSLEEFYDRNKFKGSKVTKQVVENLIMSGAFDQVEGITLSRSRYRLILDYRKMSKTKVDSTKDIFEQNKNLLNEDWWWQLQQKRLSGISFFDYQDLCERYLDGDEYVIDVEDFQLESYADSKRKVKVGGYITEVIERDGKKGKWCRLTLESNYTFIHVTIWPEQYKSFKSIDLQYKEKCLMLISGQIVFDSYKGENILQTYEDTEYIILE